MNIIKRLALVLVSIVAIGAATLAVVSRDTAPTHPALVDADLPGLIPVREFWADRDSEWAHRVSADGDWIAWRAVGLVNEVLHIARTSDQKTVATLKDVGRFYWDGDSPTLMVTSKGRLWRVDPATPDRDDWVDVTPRGFHQWHVINQPKTPDERWLVSSRDRNPALVDLYTTNQQGGDKQLLLENDGKTVFWMLSSDLTPLMRIRRGDEGMNVYQVAEGDDWRDLFTLSINTRFRIEEIAQNGSHAFVLSARGRDKAALVKVDLTTGAEEVIFDDPDEDILSILNLDPFDGVIDGVFTNINGSALHPLTEKAETLAQLAQSKGERVEISNLRWAGDARYVTATLSPDAISYTYHLFDLETGSEKQLSEFSFRRAYKDRLVKTKEVWIPARDGMDIHALLLRPKGVSGPAPLVVGVHGGPASHTIWQYHHYRQFLVNRGYAFLSVNFRGSTGFGKAYQAAGFGEYGRAMQDDLVDAANWAVAEGIADPKAMAIIGGSYGGYAAAMGMTRDAGVFKAGIVEHAVLDVPYQMRNNPFAWGLTPEYTERYFGDVKDAGDLQTMQDLSPVTHVDKIQGHILVVAGKQDRIVGFEQSEAFIAAARDAGKELEEQIFEDEGHGVGRWQNKIRHARKVEDFLAQHLGGQSGGWDYIETAADWLD